TPGPLDYYFKGPAAGGYFFVDVETGAARLRALVQGKRRVFWVTWRQSDTDPRGFVDFLLRRAGRPEPARDFRGFHVAAYALPPEGLGGDLAWAPARAEFGDAVALDAYA